LQKRTKRGKFGGKEKETKKKRGKKIEDKGMKKPRFWNPVSSFGKQESLENPKIF